MLDPEIKAELNKGLKTVQIIWGAIFMSLGIYIFICHTIGASVIDEAGIQNNLGILKTLFFCGTIVSVIVAHYIRRLILANKLNTSFRSLSADNTAKRQGPAQNIHPTAAKYLSAVIISIALSEAGGILGLVYFFLSGDFQTLYMLVAISALAMIYYYPKRDELERLARDMAQQAA